MRKITVQVAAEVILEDPSGFTMEPEAIEAVLRDAEKYRLDPALLDRLRSIWEDRVWEGNPGVAKDSRETVWIIKSGPHYENTVITGVYSTWEKALEALAVDAGLPKGWTPPQDDGSGQFHVEWWNNRGTTYMEEHEVE